MTLEEEIQQWGEEHYAAEDRTEEATWPMNKWKILPAAMDACVCVCERERERKRQWMLCCQPSLRSEVKCVCVCVCVCVCE